MTLIIKSKDETTAFLEGPADVISEIAKCFQFQPEGYMFMPGYRMGYWSGWIYPVNKKTGEFKKGLAGSIIRTAISRGYDCVLCEEDFEYLDKKLDTCDLDNISTEPGDLIKPYDFQLAGVEYALTNKRCIIESPTGSGKSLMQYMLLRSLMNANNYKKILFIVPTVSLVTQLYGDFGDYSNQDATFNHEEICHKIAEGSDKSSDKQVYISTWQSLQNIKGKQYFQEFDVVIVDECHTAKAATITRIMEAATNATIKIGFTGTLDDCTMNQNILLGMFGDVYRTATTKELMDRGILSTLVVNSITLKHLGKIPIMEYAEEIDYLVSCQRRNNLIVNLSAGLSGNSLILFERVEKHGKVLYKQLQEKYPDKDVYLIYGGVKSGKREEIRKVLEHKENAIIIASYQTFQAGINIKKLHNVIFASPSKSKIRVFQSIGRGLRTHSTKSEAVLYDISDDLRSNRKMLNHTLRHFKARLEMYINEKFNIKFIELEL